MRLFPLLLIAALFSSCFYYHFEFDEVEHYAVEATSSDTTAFEKLPVHLQKIRSFIESDKHPQLTEPGLSDSLLMAYDQMTVVSKQHYEELHEIFSDGVHFDITKSRCFPVYRDVLVFKKNGKVTGISKICFDCGKHFTIDPAGYKKELAASAFPQLRYILYPKHKNAD